MIDENKLAWEIYEVIEVLNENGAELGNASVSIIEDAIKQHLETDRRTLRQKLWDYYCEHHTDNSHKVGLTKSAKKIENLSLLQAIKLVDELFEFDNHNLVNVPKE